MAMDYVFYEDKNLVVLTATGHLSVNDLNEFLNNFLCSNSRLKSGFLELGDFRAVEVNEITVDEIRDFVGLDSSLNRPHPSKMAFVVRDDVAFGSARQYAAFAEIENKEIRPFRSMDDAKTWLGIQDMDID
jgi:hypothetical protein